MCSSLLQLALGSRGCEKNNQICKSAWIHKIWTILSQTDNFVHQTTILSLFFKVVQLYITAWGKSRDPGKETRAHIDHLGWYHIYRAIHKYLNDLEKWVWHPNESSHTHNFGCHTHNSMAKFSENLR